MTNHDGAPIIARGRPCLFFCRVDTKSRIGAMCLSTRTGVLWAMCLLGPWNGVCHYRPCRVDIQNSVDCRFFVNAGWLCKTPGESGPVIWRQPLCCRSGSPQGRVILSLGRNLTDIVVPLQIQPEGCGISQHSFKQLGPVRSGRDRVVMLL